MKVPINEGMKQYLKYIQVHIKLFKSSDGQRCNHSDPLWLLLLNIAKMCKMMQLQDMGHYLSWWTFTGHHRDQDNIGWKVQSLYLTKIFGDLVQAGFVINQKTFVREKIFRQFTSLLSHLSVIVRPSKIIMIRFITNTTLITITEYSVYHFSSPPSKAIEKLLLGKLPEATSVRLLSSRHSFCRMKIPL